MIGMRARLTVFVMAFGGGLVHPAAPETEPPVVVTTFKETHFALLADGRLMASCVARTSEAYEATARFSTDGGRTWAELRSFLHLYEDQGV